MDLKAGKLISRRAFSGKLLKIMALGTLSHFSLLGIANAAPKPKKPKKPKKTKGDACPGGLITDDLCLPGTDPDKCPGEMPSADYCPPDGNSKEDECNTGVVAADTCNPKFSKSDKCESGSVADDKCDATNTRDNCPTGQSPEDFCAPPYGLKDGDKCLGGGAFTNDKFQDICKPVGSGLKGGDECTAGTFQAVRNYPEGDVCYKKFPGDTWDECSDNIKDVCSKIKDDVCYDGTNTKPGVGGNDWCDPSPWPIVGSTGSDQCNDGTPAQDVCNGAGFTGEDGLWDSCPGGGTAVDTCHPDPPINSDDYCLGGLPSNDECKPEVGDKDECPGGLPAVDDCPTGAAPEDECTSEGGCAGGDQEGPFPPVDSCPNDTCTTPNKDAAE